MRNLKIFAALMSAMVLSSCNQEDTLEPVSNNNLDLAAEFKTEFVLNEGETAIPLSDSPIYISSDGYLPNYQNNARIAVTGPFHVEPGQGRLSIYKSNEKVRIFSDKVNNNYATGIYICDIYQYTYSVSIPAGAVLKGELAEPCGYSDYASQTKGVIVSTGVEEGGRTFAYMTYYSIVPNYNMAGQSVGGPTLPIDLRKCRFTYYIIK